MRPLLLFVIFLLVLCEADGQRKEKRMATSAQWSDSVAYFQGPEPIITGYGPLSDTLYSIYGYVFFEYERKYYIVNSLSDYYFWFTRKYPFLFRSDVSEYERFYNEQDNWNMATYILRNFKGKRLPIRFKHDIRWGTPYMPGPVHEPLTRVPVTNYH